MERSKQEKTQNDTQCQQSQELKYIGLIAGSIIHRYNNSIGVIRGYADLALRATSSGDRSYAHLKQIIEEADLAKELAEKMLIFTRQKKSEFKLTKIHSLIEETIKIFKESLAVQIDIQQDIDPMCPVVLADTDQIQQMVINLCNNAFDAMSENGGILKIILKEMNVEASFAEEYERLNEGR